MNNFLEIIEKIKSRFNGIHIEIEKHSSLGSEYAISCYGLNENLFDEAYNYIFDLNDDLDIHPEIELIPILYTREETVNHFPQIHLMLLEESMLEPVQRPRSFEIDLSLESVDLDMDFGHSVPLGNGVKSAALVAPSTREDDVLPESCDVDYSLAA